MAVILHATYFAPVRGVFGKALRSTDGKTRACDGLLQVYCGGDFEFMSTLAEFLPLDRPVTFLDAGANIGLASVLFSYMIMGQGEVIAVDANPETIKARIPARYQ